MKLPLPLHLRELSEDIEARLSRIPTQLNEYGYDPFGFQPSYARGLLSAAAILYHYYFRT